jgi:hypothetical protein
MELVIKIPEEVYEHILKAKSVPDVLGIDIVNTINAVKNGKPLPKGHGRILDEKDILDTKNNDGGWYDLVDMPEYIAGVKAIIEADKAESEVRNES